MRKLPKETSSRLRLCYAVLVIILSWPLPQTYWFNSLNSDQASRNCFTVLSPNRLSSSTSNASGDGKQKSMSGNEATVAASSIRQEWVFGKWFVWSGSCFTLGALGKFWWSLKPVSSCLVNHWIRGLKSAFMLVLATAEWVGKTPILVLELMFELASE